jgi:hypothetical protein
MRVTLFKFFLTFAAGLIIIAFYWFFLKTPFLILNISPPESSVKIDGKEVTLGDENRLPLKRGIHSIEIYKEGFVPFKKTIKISSFKNEELSVVLKKIPVPLKLLEEPVLDFESESNQLYFLNKSGFIAKINLFHEDGRFSKNLNIEAFPLSEDFEIKNNYLLIKNQNKYILYDANAYQIGGGRLKELPEGVILAQFAHFEEKIAAVLALPSGKKELIIYDFKLNPLIALDARKLNFPLKIAWLKDDSGLLVVDNSGDFYIADLFTREFNSIPLDKDEGALALKSNPYNNLVAVETIRSGKVIVKIWDSKEKNFLKGEKETTLLKSTFLDQEESLILFSRKEGGLSLEKWQPKSQTSIPLYFSLPQTLTIKTLGYSSSLNAIIFSDENGFIYKLLIEDGKYR